MIDFTQCEVNKFRAYGGANGNKINIRYCQRHFKMSIFAEMGCRFLQGSIQVLYSLIHHITCRFEARQALIYQLASGLTGENGKYNYSKAVHLYPPFFDIFCSPKNYKTASALTVSDPDIERKSRRNALTQGVAGAFPFASYELSDAGGIFLGLNLYNRSPVFMDFFDDYKYTNGNFAAFGSSGAGKSTILQCIAKRLREQGRKIICIVPEKGHEYRPLCEAMGGQFIKLGPSSPDCIGLMEIRQFSAGAYGGQARRNSLLAEKVSWLSVWYSLQKQGLTEEDRSYIGSSLIECYGRFGIAFDNASLFEEDGEALKEMPMVKDWYDLLMERPETRHLAVVLTRYMSGSAASMGGQTNVDTDNLYIVIDLTGLSDDLQLAAVYAATGFATGVIVQNGDVGTALLSDELWKLLGANSSPLAADYTMQMVKLIRSQGGIAGVASQGRRT